MKELCLVGVTASGLNYCGGNVWFLGEQSPCGQGTGRGASRLPFYLSKTGDSGVTSIGVTLVLLVNSLGARIYIWQARSPVFPFPEQKSAFCALKGSKAPPQTALEARLFPFAREQVRC